MLFTTHAADMLSFSSHLSLKRSSDLRDSFISVFFFFKKNMFSFFCALFVCFFFVAFFVCPFSLFFFDLRRCRRSWNCVLVEALLGRGIGETQVNCVLVVERWSCTLEEPWTCVVDVTRDWHFVPDPSGWLQLKK